MVLLRDLVPQTADELHREHVLRLDPLEHRLYHLRRQFVHLHLPPSSLVTEFVLATATVEAEIGIKDTVIRSWERQKRRKSLLEPFWFCALSLPRRSQKFHTRRRREKGVDRIVLSLLEQS
jgi:hypothetical protein